MKWYLWQPRKVSTSPFLYIQNTQNQVAMQGPNQTYLPQVCEVHEKQRGAAAGKVGNCFTQILCCGHSSTDALMVYFQSAGKSFLTHFMHATN